MPFKHIIKEDIELVIIKAVGEVTIKEMLSEITNAIITKRGMDIPRRLIDMRNETFDYSIEDAKKLLKALHKEGDLLNIEKIALLFKEIPQSFDFKQIIPDLNSPSTSVRMFVNKDKAIEFLNEAG